MPPTVSWEGMHPAEPPLDPGALGMYVRTRYGVSDDPAQGLLVFVQLPARVSWFVTPGRFLRRLEDGGFAVLDMLVHGAANNPELPPAKRDSLDVVAPQNVYLGGALVRESQPWYRRGGKANVLCSSSAWADLDVKPGSFRSSDQIDAVIDELDAEGLGPQIVVATGGGGRHCHWAPGTWLGADEIEHIGRGVAMLIEQRYGVGVDRCHNADRILRAPGLVWQPKEFGQHPQPVTMLRCEGPADPDLGRLREAIAPYWAAERTRQAAAKRRVSQTMKGVGADMLDMSSELVAAGLVSELNSWDGLYLRSMVEHIFNTTRSWADILVPAGWTRYGEPDSEGRQQWTRPGGGGGGGSRRSAVVDWAQSPHVMSLLSDSPEVGARLRQLADDNVKLTKVLVAAALGWDGDVRAMLKEFINQEVRDVADDAAAV
jgi:hypothetical protein